MKRNFALLSFVLEQMNAAHVFNDGEKSNEERKNLKDKKESADKMR